MEKNFLHRISLALFLSLPLCLLAQNAFVPASDSRLRYVGRVSFSTPEAAVFTYPGIQIHATFEGSSIRMLTKPGSGYFMVELDELPPFKVHSSDENNGDVLLAEGLSQGLHRLTLTYANEGLVMKPAFYGLRLDEGCTLGDAPTLPQRRMEFIGNSITCGFGIEGDGSEKRFSYSQENVFYTYEARTARELNAQWQVVARSGIGVYRNTNGHRSGDKAVMPALFPHTLFGTSGERWDFSRYQPDVVCVNLGTNDTTLPAYDAALLTAAMNRFVQTLRKHYPQAHIVLLSGPMVQGQRLADVKAANAAAASNARQRGDRKVYTFDFTPDDGSLGYGTYKHPSMQRHQRMAEELTPFIRKITGWQ